MNFNKLYYFIVLFFYIAFWAASLTFSAYLYLFLSLSYGTQVYSFAAIPAICRLCLWLFWGVFSTFRPLYVLFTCKSSVNHLGIIITNKLKWDSHITQRISRAQQKLFLKRNVAFSTKTRVKVSLYKSYILSILLYASNVWFSNCPNCRKLENMQRRALKWALNNKFLTDSDYN